ncbi:hypothetical protein ATL39_3084 [Sinobaca qinghaiensis]|uniref:DUF6440 domain-containing protein n=1 Tax=Sinobaca qinghaiensis TaxID=342944 RepID=A0A419UWY5_9BACL|nr:DUF6440 family protein [Sinobaca qinghaiensis]RKD69658.1 hypothetical protein ATL39_3084 [Sinobaca qinghaiensis]
MKNNRFEAIYKQGAIEQFKVIRDNETGVLYLLNGNATGGGLTVMVDQEGNPLIDEDFQKQ